MILLRRFYFIGLLFMSTISMGAMAEELEVDPWQGFNRVVFEFNKTVVAFANNECSICLQLTKSFVDIFVSNENNIGATVEKPSALFQGSGFIVPHRVFGNEFGLNWTLLPVYVVSSLTIL